MRGAQRKGEGFSRLGTPLLLLLACLATILLVSGSPSGEARPLFQERWLYGGVPRTPWQVASGAWTVAHGVVRQSDSRASLLFEAGQQLGDGAISFTFTTPANLSRSGDIAVLFRVRDSSDFYYFSTATRTTTATAGASAPTPPATGTVTTGATTLARAAC